MHAVNTFKVLPSSGFPLKMLNLENVEFLCQKPYVSCWKPLLSLEFLSSQTFNLSHAKNFTHRTFTFMCFFLTFGHFLAFENLSGGFSFILMLMLSFYSAFEKPLMSFSHTKLIFGCENLNFTPWNCRIFHASSPSCQVNIIFGLIHAFFNKWNKTCTSPCLLPKLGVCCLCLKHFVIFFNV